MLTQQNYDSVSNWTGYCFNLSVTTWYHITAGELVFDRNTGNHITVCKPMIIIK